MTPKTRSTNKDANYKVYYAKKVPLQVRFPHKRKTVRRPPPPAQDVSDKRQMRFLPEKMRIKRNASVGSYESGAALDTESHKEEVEQSTAKAPKTRKTKRPSEAMQADTDDDEDPVRPRPKRRRQATEPTRERHSKKIKVESADEDGAMRHDDRKTVDRSRTLRRQSTMTQMVEGRRPMSDDEEPKFKPVKRSPRVSWGGLSRMTKDQKQRTLTQMVHGLKPAEIVFDDDMEETLSDAETSDRDSQAYGDAISARLAHEGLLQNKSDGVEETVDQDWTPHDVRPSIDYSLDRDGNLPVNMVEVPSLVVESIENASGGDDEDSYQPTQFIDAPTTRTRPVTRRKSGRADREPQPAITPSAASRRAGHLRFGLLSTPEKRRIREIPSSQSPTESSLSTQVSPLKAVRSPLQQCSANTIPTADTPSRRKQVTFYKPAQEQRPPPSLRKFRSVIQDSEDEEEDLLEETTHRQGQEIDEHMQASNASIDTPLEGTTIGAQSQAMLDHINHACEDAYGDTAWLDRNSSEEPGTPNIMQVAYEQSPELGEQPTQLKAAHGESASELHLSYPVAQQVSLGDIDTVTHSLLGEQGSASNVPVSSGEEFSTTQEQVPSSPPLVQQHIEDTCPSTPLVIMDDSTDEEEELDPTPPSTVKRPMHPPPVATLQHSADLDGEPIQVPRSPSAQQETQQSHTSKAEQQLQNEWFSYSQYVGTRLPQSSSMNVAHDKFSYHATPLPPGNSTGLHQSGHYTSQATTVDEVTPRKKRRHRTISANMTPHKIANSQPFISPSKPPPLFIPSSFPSPAKARIDEWSSPLLGETQDLYGTHAGGSMEDFSIPLPPPVEDD
jgi:hypothetical protein